MRASELDYDLPAELIAQHPATQRNASRLLVADRATGAVRHRRFSDLPEEVGGYLTVVNDTRVIPARLHLRRPAGQWRCSSSSPSATGSGKPSPALPAGYGAASV